MPQLHPVHSISRLSTYTIITNLQIEVGQDINCLLNEICFLLPHRPCVAGAFTFFAKKELFCLAKADCITYNTYVIHTVL